MTGGLLVLFASAQRWYARYGFWSLLLTWLPISGDALTFIADIMKARRWLFLVLVGPGKTARYVSITYLSAWIS